MPRQTRNRAKETKGPCGSTDAARVCMGLHSEDARGGKSHKHLPVRSLPSRSGCKPAAEDWMTAAAFCWSSESAVVPGTSHQRWRCICPPTQQHSWKPASPFPLSPSVACPVPPSCGIGSSYTKLFKYRRAAMTRSLKKTTAHLEPKVCQKHPKATFIDDCQKLWFLFMTDLGSYPTNPK